MRRRWKWLVATPVALAALFAAALAPEAFSGRKEIKFSYAKLLIEHNATDEDTGFQMAADGEAWNRLDVLDPDGNPVLSVTARGSIQDLGLTEMFFETQEPENAEVPIPEVLANLPEGDYEFEGISVDGVEMDGVATLTHAIPAGPVILSPDEGEVVDPGSDLEIDWEHVTETIDGDPVNVTHYQVIVEKDEKLTHPGFGRSLFSVHVPSSITSMRVPAEFLEARSPYKFEVLALEESGNQTLSSSEFETE